MTVVGERLQPTLFEKSRPGRGGDKIPHPPKDALDRIPESARRSSAPALPELNEPEVVRHYVNLSQLNYAIDTGFYPLGSCTMKFNPKLNEWAARLPGFATLHPLAPDEVAQGTLQLLWELEAILAEVSGMRAVTLQPAAGAHGELCGILMVRAYHHANGDLERDEVLVPDSSHGTNPATASMAGFRTITIPSAADGGVDVDAFRAALGPRTAAVMITNPSTLGLFEKRIGELLDAVHEAGALAYMDGANLNAILGRFRPGEAGFDVMHFNLHKTFSTPHGGGGPGAGPVGVSARLEPFLPAPLPILAEGDPERVFTDAMAGRSTPGIRFALDDERPDSVGKVRSCHGNFGMFVRAYTYIRSNGDAGLRTVSEDAVLAANYLRVKLRDAYDLPYDRLSKHEVVFSGRRQKRENGVTTLDIAKAILDHGVHPPTIYFPLIVEEALMVEPTETETLETLDHFVGVMREIAALAETDPDAVRRAPTTTPVSRLDEAAAARRPDLRHDLGPA
jgi:glycine dehydrogenase subunit 2